LLLVLLCSSSTQFLFPFRKLKFLTSVPLHRPQWSLRRPLPLNPPGCSLPDSTKPCEPRPPRYLQSRLSQTGRQRDNL
jgi:hypothetical protein